MKINNNFYYKLILLVPVLLLAFFCLKSTPLVKAYGISTANWKDSKTLAVVVDVSDISDDARINACGRGLATVQVDATNISSSILPNSSQGIVNGSTVSMDLDFASAPSSSFYITATLCNTKALGTFQVLPTSSDTGNSGSGLCAKRQFPCAYKCDEDTGACIADPNKLNGNGTTPGVVGDTCEFPGVQSTCGEGLVCGSDLKCKTNNGSNNPGGGGTGGGAGGDLPGANPEWCNNDPNLTYSNGVCLPKNAGFAKTGFAGSTSLSDLMVKVIQFFLTFAGIVGVLILVVGGYWYLSSGGNEETAEKGKKAIINAIIGLVVVILAYTIVTIISSTLIADTFVK